MRPPGGRPRSRPPKAQVQSRCSIRDLRWRRASNAGPLRNVTDLAPTCAGCHSSFNKEQLRGEPEAFAAGQVKETKHYKAIEEGAGPYAQMSPADRQKLLADVKLMDELAGITLSAPT